MLCADCGEVYLVAEEDDKQRLIPTPLTQSNLVDEFEIEIEEPDDNDSAANPDQTVRTKQFICSRAKNDWMDPETAYDRASGEILRSESDDEVRVRLARHHEPNDKIRCVTCDAPDSQAYLQFKPIRVGAPFYLGVAIPTLLAHAPADDRNGANLPYEGRQLITFTDSRQGTARFAARMEFEAERNFVRSFVYHKLWSLVRMPSEVEIEKLRSEVAQLELAAKAVPGLEAVLEDKRQQFKTAAASLDIPHASISWGELIQSLAATRAVQYFIPEATNARYSLALVQPAKIAEMLLFREFARRPRSGSSLETLGLASLHFPTLERSVPPQEWIARGQSKETWYLFLKVCLDFFLRANFCVNITPELRRWMGMKFQTRYVRSPESDRGPVGTRLWPTLKTNPKNDQRLLTFLQLALLLKKQASDAVL